MSASVVRACLRSDQSTGSFPTRIRSHQQRRGKPSPRNRRCTEGHLKHGYSVSRVMEESECCCWSCDLHTIVAHVACNVCIVGVELCCCACGFDLARAACVRDAWE